MVTARRNKIASRNPNQLSGSGEVKLIMNRSRYSGAKVPNGASASRIIFHDRETWIQSWPIVRGVTRHTQNFLDIEIC
jgi:hypothetical protein